MEIIENSGNGVKCKKISGSKKGFIFTLLALLVIAFMIIEISIYFSTFQLRQESAPLQIRTRVVEEFATQLAKPNVEKISYIAAYNAVYSLDQDSVAIPVQTGTSIENISNAIGSLVWDGTRSDTGSTLITAGTLKGWKTGLETLAQTSGITLSMNCTNFIVNQSDAWTVQVNYTFTYTLNDAYTKTRISDRYNISVNVPITGFEDSLFKNKTKIVCPTCTRNIFPYSGPVTATKIFDVNSNARGRGWFYGDIFKGRLLANYADFNESDFNPDNKKMILYTNNRNLVITYGNMFGAIIYTGPDFVDYSSFGSSTVPFISSNTIPVLPLAVLIKSGSDSDDLTSNFTIYDIENVVDFMKCGYYTTNKNAPSFFDRLSAGRPTVRLLNDTFGIETSIVGLGSWTSRDKSSIDYEYYAAISGSKVIGTTGCKFFDLCKDTTLPKFRISPSHASAYGLDNLICTNSNNVGRCE